MMNRLVRFDADLRYAYLSDLFVASETDWNLIQNTIKNETELYFGECSGKHSNVSRALNTNDFEVVSEDQDFIAKFLDIVGDCVGCGIMSYIKATCPKCQGEKEEDAEFCDNCEDDD